MEFHQECPIYPTLLHPQEQACPLHGVGLAIKERHTPKAATLYDRTLILKCTDNLHCDTFWCWNVPHYSIKTLHIAAHNFQFIKKQPINMLNSKLSVLIKYPLHKPVFELMELQWAFAPLQTRSCSAARCHRYLLWAQKQKDICNREKANP